MNSVVLGECATVYKNNPHTIEVLQQEISAAVISVSEETLAAVLQNYRRRLQMVLDADGAHIENFVRDCQSPKTTEL
jgi:adenine deaminase